MRAHPHGHTTTEVGATLAVALAQTPQLTGINLKPGIPVTTGSHKGSPYD